MSDSEAVINLKENQFQLDADGCMVGVSRQALDEALEQLATLQGDYADLHWAHCELEQERARADELLQRLRVVVGMGDKAPLHTITTSVENAIRRSRCLSRIEQFHIVVTDEKDEYGDPVEECPLNWGQEPDQYEEIYAAVIARREAALREQLARMPVCVGYITAMDAHKLLKKIDVSLWGISQSITPIHTKPIYTDPAPQEEHAGGRDAAAEFGNTLAGKK